jgi:oligoribonuclease
MLNWFDVETTGINDDGFLLEVGCILTDDNLNELARLALIVDPLDPDLAYDYANEFVRTMHTENGLWQAIRRGEGRPKARVEERFLDLVLEHSHGEKHPLCGNTIGFDRRWLKRHMPSLEESFHYRNIDVSTLKETMRRFWPHRAPFEKDKNHRVLDDIEGSIAEFRHYIEFWGWAP